MHRMPVLPGLFVLPVLYHAPHFQRMRYRLGASGACMSRFSWARSRIRDSSVWRLPPYVCDLRTDDLQRMDM